MPIYGDDTRIEDSWVICSIRVAYADTDMMGHVYYGNYLVYFENARSEWMRKLGMTYRSFEELEYVVPVVEAHVRYKGRIFYDDLIEVRTAVRLKGSTRTEFHYSINRVGEKKILAEGRTVHCVINMKTGKPCRVPAPLKDLVEKLPPFTP
ncbi:MAG: thioesterase family protein [Candidatus Electryonea clarkiae]|nr:thioesterase family protein [Candidatus Electryonea clarkiae]MDP8286211.1 thioesterase family protein [Candidatus Electryonea clarkiae]